MRPGLISILCGALLFCLPALAQDIPLGDADFGAYLQQKVQLYSPQPVRVVPPFTLAIGEPGRVNLVYDFKALHDECVAQPVSCPQKTHDFVQGIVARFPAAAQLPPPPPKVPSDKHAFMEYLAEALAHLMPAARIAVDDMTLNVTRNGGRAIPFDESGYYTLCSEAEFRCDAALAQALQRTADWLALPDPSRLRVSLHVMANCAVQCEVTQSLETLSPFFRKAFANLEELCFKPVAKDNMVPLTAADRRDMGLTADAAFDLCEKSTREALGPAKFVAPGADGVGHIEGLYAASRALVASDFAGLANGGPLLIALPGRDLLLYIKSDAPAQQAALRERAQAAATGGLAIGADIYRWSASGWLLVPQ